MGIDVIVALILAAISVIITVTSALLTPSPDLDDAKPSGLGDFNFPTNLESRYLPVVFGTTELNAPNVVWYGDFSSYPLTTGGTVVGYRYSLGIQLALCYGPLDSISEMKLDEEYVFRPGEQGSLSSGAVPAQGYPQTVNGQRTLSFNDPNLFGGTKQGGGLIGNMTIYYGTDNQIPSAYIQDQELDNMLELPDASSVSQSEIVPSYAGVANLVWEGGEFSERAVIPAIVVTVHRYPTSLTDTFRIVNQDQVTGHGDANPIHCLYEIMTEERWGLQIDPLLIDRDSFLRAAEQCHVEGNGFGLTVDSTRTAKVLVDQINDQVNGMLFQNEEGLFEYNLIRRDYDPEELYVLNYDGTVASETQAFALSGTADLAQSGADYVIDNFTLPVNLAVLSEGGFIRVAGPSVSGVFIVKTINNSLKVLTLTPIDSQDYTGLEGAAIEFDIFRLSGIQYVPDLGESDITKIKSAERQSWDETFNVAQVKYLDREDFFKETVATSHDMGNLAIRNSTQSIKKYDMQGVRTRASASIIAQRKLRALSYPVTTLTVEVHRRFSNLRPSQVIRINMPDFGLDDFFMRILEVSLPSDRNSSVILKGIRDTFDEPLLADVIHIGGESDLSLAVSSNVVPPNVNEVLVDGMPLFLHNREGLGAEFHTWHVVGQPSPTTSSGVARQFSSDTYFDVSDSGALAPVGRVVAHMDELWEDEINIAKRWYDRRDSSFVYGVAAGPMANPSLAHSNVGSTWDTANTKAANTGGTFLYSHEGDPISTTMGDIVITDLTVSSDILSDSFTEAAIREFGFGLAIIRPEWANGDDTFDEIVAYERLESFTLYFGETFVTFTNNATGITVSDTIRSISTVPQEDVFATRSGVNLFNVHRGLLDTGVQQINGGSQIFFISSGDTLYDRVGQSGTVNNQTYRHQTLSVGGRMDMEDGFDVTVLAEDIQRRSKPMPPKTVTVNGGSYNEAWGFSFYDNSEWQDLRFPLAGNGGIIDLNWGYKDLVTNSDRVNFYNDTDSSSLHCQLTFNLIDDDRASSLEREAHARAYWKEGWMPTSPAMSHNDLGSTDVAFSATNTSSIITGTSLTGYGLGGLFTSGGATLTVGQEYFAEVIWRGANAAGTEFSHGAQRNIIRFTA